MPHLVLLLSLALATLPGFAHAVPGTPVTEDDSAELRSRGRKALAHPPVDATWQVEGTMERQGASAPWSWTIGPGGRNHEQWGGPMAEQVGRDELGWWALTPSGSAYPLTLQERDEAQLGLELLGGKWALESSQLQLERSADVDSAGREAWSFRLAPGPLRGVLWFDPEIGLPVGYRSRVDAVVAEGSIAWGSQGDGWALRSHSQRRASGEESRLTVHNWRKLAPGAAVASLGPRPAGTGTRWRGGVPASPPSRRTASGHLLVGGTLGDSDGWFIFDTGAGGTVIDLGLAQRLDPERVGQQPVGGVGGFVDAELYRGAELGVGPLVLEDPLLIAIDLAFLSDAFGVEVLGIVGFDLLSRSVVVLDQARGSVEFHRDATGLAGSTWEAILLQSRHAAIAGVVEDEHEALFKLDNGAARRSLTLHAPFVQSEGLLEGRTTRAGAVHGVGGGTAVREGRLASFELGGVRHEQLAVEFATAGDGAFSDAYTAGNVGGLLLEGRRLVLDYPRLRCAWLPGETGP